MKVLLDVGANIGQSARAALDPRYGFDRVYCFEPAPTCWPEIDAIADPRIELCKFGLGSETCRKTLYRAGYLGASVYEDAASLGASDQDSTSIELIRASDWFAGNVSERDTVFVKLNCEGSECDIVDDLIRSGELRKAYNVMIDFDVRFIPSLRAREVQVRDKLRREGYTNIAFSEDVMRGETHADRLSHWLDLVGAREDLPVEALRRKYAPTLKRLSARTGAMVRIELALRRNAYDRLPAPVRSAARSVWRAIRGRATREKGKSGQ